MVTTGAGIHRRNQLESRRIVSPVRRAGEMNVTVFEWLAQRFKHAAFELGQLVEKKHAAVRKRYLPGARDSPATDNRRR